MKNRYYTNRHYMYTDKIRIAVSNMNKDIKELSEYCDKLEKQLQQKDNIINGMENFFQYAYDNEVRPLNDRKVSVWTICLDKLQELKGSDKK